MTIDEREYGGLAEVSPVVQDFVNLNDSVDNFESAEVSFVASGRGLGFVVAAGRCWAWAGFDFHSCTPIRTYLPHKNGGILCRRAEDHKNVRSHDHMNNEER